MSLQNQKASRVDTFQSILCWVFVIYVYFSMLPSRSVYLNYIPNFRNIILVFLNMLFGVYLLIYSPSKIKGIIPFVGIFILSNLISYVTNDQLLTNDALYLIGVDLIVIFCFLKLPLQSAIYKRFIAVGTILIFLGLSEYIIRLITGFDIYLATNVARGEESYIVYDHGLFNIYPLEPIPRFQGLFREAGMLGICAGLLLFNAQNIDRKQIIIWTIGGFFSLSLSFYVLACLALVYHMFVTKLLHNVKLTVLISLSFIIIFIAAKPILDEAIFDRIELYSEIGDNRTDKNMNDDLQILIHSDDVWWGYGNESFIRNGYTWGNAGFKAELYKYGLVLIALFIIGFGVLLFSYPYSRKQKIITLSLFAIIFYIVDCKYAIHIYIILLSMFNPYVIKNITSNRSAIVK